MPGDDPAAVDAYIAGLPPWQRDLARRVEAILLREVPGLRRTIKWGWPAYGTHDHGWFLSLAGFKAHVKVTFFRGVDLEPVPPSGSGKGLRALDLREGDPLDEGLLATWIRQAAAMPGMGA